MKKLLALSLLAVSFNSFAGTTALNCRNAEGVLSYEATIGEKNRTLDIKPLIKDETSLSSENVTLKYNEGESTREQTSYEAQNSKGQLIVVELELGIDESVKTYDIIPATVYYNNKSLTTLDGLEKLNCSIN